jgi:hypothetical protein
MTWDPTTSHFTDQEVSMTDYAGTIIPRNASFGGGERIQHGDAYVINSFCSLSTDPVIVTDDDNFHTALLAHVQISPLNGTLRSHKAPRIDPLMLSTW